MVTDTELDCVREAMAATLRGNSSAVLAASSCDSFSAILAYIVKHSPTVLVDRLNLSDSICEELWKVADVAYLLDLPENVAIVIAGASAFSDAEMRFLDTLIDSGRHSIFCFERKVFVKKSKNQFSLWKTSPAFRWKLACTVDLDASTVLWRRHLYR